MAIVGRSKQSGDVVIDGKAYMLPRDRSARLWDESPVLSADFSRTLPDTVRADQFPEIRINWDTKHKGFGEPLRRVGGRDYYGQNVDKRYPGQITLARNITTITPAETAGADPTGFAVLGTHIYVAYGNYVLNVDPSDDSYTAAAKTGTTSIVNFQGKLFLGRGTGNPFEHSTDGSTWTPHTGSLTAVHFVAAQNRLYKISKKQSGGTTVPSYLSNNPVDPTDNLNWAAEDVIGDSEVPATGLANLAYQVFVAKEDGLYAADIETGRWPSLTPEVSPWRNTTNGDGVRGWGGLLFYPTVRGLKFFYSGVLVTAGPEVMSANDSEVVGRFTALAGDANWLYGAYYNGSNTYILAGRPAKSEDMYPGEFIWNCVWYIAGGPYTAMEIISINNDPRLWLAKQGQLAYIKLGNQMDNPLQDSTAVYASTGTDYYPANDGGSPSVDKYFLELRVWCENLNSTRFITWSYRLDDTAAWTTLGVTNTSPVQVLKFNPGADCVGRRIQLKAAWTRGATTTETPILRNVECLAVEFPENRKILTFNIWAGPGIWLRNENQDNRGAAAIINELEGFANAKKVVNLVDPLGREYTALPLRPVMVKELISPDFRESTVVAQARYLVY